MLRLLCLLRATATLLQLTLNTSWNITTTRDLHYRQCRPDRFGPFEHFDLQKTSTRLRPETVRDLRQTTCPERYEIVRSLIHLYAVLHH